MAETHGDVIDIGAGIELDGAVLAEDREAARAALPITLVGSDEAVIVEPAHGVGLAGDALQLLGRADPAVAGLVDVLEIDRAGGEMRHDLAGLRIDDGEVVVLLQRHHDEPVLVDVDEFRLRIGRLDGGDAGHVDDLAGRAIDGAVLDPDQGQIAGGKLRQGTLVELLVTLVLDGDDDLALVLGQGDRIRLAAEIAFRQDLLGLEVDGGEMAGRLLEIVAGGDDGDEGLVAEDRDRGGFAFERHEAGGLGIGGIGDVDDPQRLLLRIGIGEQRTVAIRRDDLGDGLLGGIAIGRQVLRHGEGGDPIEERLGHGRAAEQDSGESREDEGLAHGISPLTETETRRLVSPCDSQMTVFTDGRQRRPQAGPRPSA